MPRREQSEQSCWLGQHPYFSWLTGNQGTGTEGWIQPSMCAGLVLTLQSVQAPESCSQGRGKAGHSAFKTSFTWFVKWGQSYTDCLGLQIQRGDTKAWCQYERGSKLSNHPPEKKNHQAIFCISEYYFLVQNKESWNILQEKWH